MHISDFLHLAIYFIINWKDLKKEVHKIDHGWPISLSGPFYRISLSWINRFGMRLPRLYIFFKYYILFGLDTILNLVNCSFYVNASLWLSCLLSTFALAQTFRFFAWSSFPSWHLSLLYGSNYHLLAYLWRLIGKMSISRAFLLISTLIIESCLWLGNTNFLATCYAIEFFVFVVWLTLMYFTG